MKPSQRRKVLIPLLSIFFLTFVSSVSTAQINQTSSSEPKISQEKKPTSIPGINSLTLKDAVQMPKDSNQRIVPVITGELFWWIICTVLVGTLIAIAVVVVSGAFSSHQLEPGEKNQYISEVLPTLVEGITIVYIVLSVLLLSILGITSAEGTLSIFAGISGYVLGKKQSSERGKDSLPSGAETSKNDDMK
jgi:Na+-transporting methylmalonyl-CoA/oxaloacetate decarboxylase gamma subunit